MGKRYTCSQGHLWEAHGGATCPICGAAGAGVDDTTVAAPAPVAEPTTPAASVLPPVPSHTVPGYELLGELGRGGMGVVYKARDLTLKRLVAIKMVLHGIHASQEELRRFSDEAATVAQLTHPNIVRLHAYGESNGVPYFTLEYCPGGSLANRIEAPWQPGEAAGLVETLARAVQAAHDKQIVHRDLKPGNVLLGEDGTPKISDFGLSRRLDAVTLTTSGTVLGTPAYMAPEQASGRIRAIGQATDIYALGGILYELLTGKPPFQAETSAEILFRVLNEEPAPPRQHNPKVPRDLETICLKCLRKEAVSRYPSASALADDLRRFQNHEPILACPVPLSDRFGFWWRQTGIHVFPPILIAAYVLYLVVAGTIYLAAPAVFASVGVVTGFLLSLHLVAFVMGGAGGLVHGLAFARRLPGEHRGPRVYRATVTGAAIGLAFALVLLLLQGVIEATCWFLQR